LKHKTQTQLVFGKDVLKHESTTKTLLFEFQKICSNSKLKQTTIQQPKKKNQTKLKLKLKLKPPTVCSISLLTRILLIKKKRKRKKKNLRRKASSSSSSIVVLDAELSTKVAIVERPAAGLVGNATSGAGARSAHYPTCKHDFDEFVTHQLLTETIGCGLPIGSQLTQSVADGKRRTPIQDRKKSNLTDFD